MSYVIRRIDKDFGQFTHTHQTLEEATEEARRLAKRHADEDPAFTVYELTAIKQVSAEITITEVKCFVIVDGEENGKKKSI